MPFEEWPDTPSPLFDSIIAVLFVLAMICLHAA